MYYTILLALCNPCPLAWGSVPKRFAPTAAGRKDPVAGQGPYTAYSEGSKRGTTTANMGHVQAQFLADANEKINSSQGTN